MICNAILRTESHSQSNGQQKDCGNGGVKVGVCLKSIDDGPGQDGSGSLPGDFVAGRLSILARPKPFTSAQTWEAGARVSEEFMRFRGTGDSNRNMRHHAMARRMRASTAGPGARRSTRR